MLSVNNWVSQPKKNIKTSVNNLCVNPCGRGGAKGSEFCLPFDPQHLISPSGQSDALFQLFTTFNAKLVKLTLKPLKLDICESLLQIFWIHVCPRGMKNGL